MEFTKYNPGYPLKTGYELYGMRITSGYCGDGGSELVELRFKGRTVLKTETCACGRGCGGYDCVTDWNGAHDTVLEEFRADAR